MNTSAKSRYCRTVCEFIAVSAMFALIALGFGRLPERVSDIYTVSAGTDERGRVVVIDAGHGGEDGGASSPDGVLESGLNLQFALRMRDLLQFAGVETMMLRETDTALYTDGCSGIAEKKVSDLKNRVLRTNQAPNAVLLSVHQNFFTEAKYRGAQVFYAKTDGSRELAEAMQAALRTGVDPDNHRQAKPSQGVYLMEHVNGTAVLVECGFLSNAAETALLQDEGYQQRLSAAVCGALTEWLEGRGTEDEV